MLLILEIFTALIGLKLLHLEAVRNRFTNYATSTFLICFVPLFCIYPVIARIVVGGAYSVRPGEPSIVSDPFVYLVYQLFCLGVLAAFFFTSNRPSKFKDVPMMGWQRKYRLSFLDIAALLSVVFMGVYLYIFSTGMSAFDLISASRFEWFKNPEYSPTAYVVSSYLLALSPVAIILALPHRRHWWVVGLIIAALAFFGLMAKDRKWLIFIMSALFAYTYLKNNFSIVLRPKLVIVGVLIVAVLAFWQVGRGVIFDYILTGQGDVIYDSQQIALKLLTRGDLPYYYNASITAIELNLNQEYMIPFGILRRQLLFFLPSSFSFGLKIEDISALFADKIDAGDSLRRGNMPPGFFGLFILSFGAFGGIATCSMVTFGIRAIDRVIQRNRDLISVVLAAHFLSSTLLLLRGDDSSATYFILSSLAIISIVRMLDSTRQENRVPEV
jgi:hypothetical protein